MTCYAKFRIFVQEKKQENQEVVSDFLCSSGLGFEGNVERRQIRFSACKEVFFNPITDISVTVSYFILHVKLDDIKNN